MEYLTANLGLTTSDFDKVLINLFFIHIESDGGGSSSQYLCGSLLGGSGGNGGDDPPDDHPTEIPNR